MRIIKREQPAPLLIVLVSFDPSREGIDHFDPEHPELLTDINSPYYGEQWISSTPKDYYDAFFKEGADSLVDYYKEMTGGKFWFYPAKIDHPVNSDQQDGIITLVAPFPHPAALRNFRGYDNKTAAHQAIHDIVKMCDQYIDFSKYDLNGDGEISYILFKGEEGNNEAIYRTKYSVEEADKKLKAAGKKPLKFYDASNKNGYLVDKNGQWSAAAAAEYMTTALTEYNAEGGNMIELVIANNDGMAEGAISALGAVGYNKGKGSPTVPVFGVDATEAARSLIANGQMSGTIKQDESGMAKALRHLAQNALSGRDLLADTGGIPSEEDVRKLRIRYEKYVG